MDEVDPLIIHDYIKTYPIEDLKLTDEVYQSANHRPKIGRLVHVGQQTMRYAAIVRLTSNSANDHMRFWLHHGCASCTK